MQPLGAHDDPSSEVAAPVGARNKSGHDEGGEWRGWIHDEGVHDAGPSMARAALHPYTSVSYRSSQSGFCPRIRLIFQRRGQCFMVFSRWMAETMSSWYSA